jgi:hypothetical protein
MAAKNYGTIAIIPDGEWVDTKQYKVGRVVSYKGSSYLVHTLPPIGTLPTNTNYYQLSAQGGGVATEDSPGVVKPDNNTIKISDIGTISAKKATGTDFGITTAGNGTKISPEGKIDVDTNFVQAVNLANIIANEAFTNILGKISKTIAVTMGLDENALLKSMLTNQMENSTSKIPTVALVYALNQTVIGLNSNLTDLSAKIVNRGQFSGNLNDIQFVLNTITAYMAVKACINLPIANVGGIVETMFIDSNSYAIQRFTTLEATPRFFVRTKISTWNAWVEK